MLRMRWLIGLTVLAMVVGPLALAAETAIYEFKPEMIAAAWQPFLDPETEEFLAPGTVTFADGKVTIGLTFGEPWGGGVMSPWLLVDLSKQPVIVLKNVQPTEKWTLKAHVRSLKPDWKIEGWGVYLHGDTNISGDVEIVLIDALKEFAPLSVVRKLPQGPIALRLWMWGVGGSVSLDGIRIVYRGE